MNFLEFIFGIIVLIVAFITIIGITGMRYDTKKLEEENDKLREKLRNKTIKEIKKTKKEDK